MASVVFYFQMHQPRRARPYSVFDTRADYFDDDLNDATCRKVAEKCYRPATKLILDLIRRHEGRFRVAYSITGVLLDQLERAASDVLDLLRTLSDTGCVEFIAETDRHSLAILRSEDEFREQVAIHMRRMQSLLGVTPRVFRNTELIYSNDAARIVSSMNDARGKPLFDGMLAEGVDRLLGFRSPAYVYTPPTQTTAGRPFGLLLRNYRLSDDIAFRFSNRSWSHWPLRAETFAQWVNQINGDGHVCNLFMDYETFGEHQWADTGIFDFLSALPEKIFDVHSGHNHFDTPSEALARCTPVGVYDAPEWTSWADTERDCSAWLGNAMQTSALDTLYALEADVKACAPSDPALLNDWRDLTTSDHLYYMCTKHFADGDVHTYFSPYDSPYDAYINFMNICDNLRQRIDDHARSATPASHEPTREIKPRAAPGTLHTHAGSGSRKAQN